MFRWSYPVVLASASPRRRELLAQLIPEFEVVRPDIEEDALTLDDPWQTAQRLAREKALAVFEDRPEALVIGGDTVVAVMEGGRHTQLAKPPSSDEACAMLARLSGREHLVITGVAVRWPRGMEAFTETSKVAFRPLTSDEIAAYVATGEPMDKAGAYAIQGGASAFVERVEGSMSNVVGLPLERLEEALKSLS